ncbi:MAG TPA: hypothetical protein O0X50_03420 [Methanocorpusculum sp.]|nr:hypothetical protein [Methanocorpusculum sp.]
MDTITIALLVRCAVMLGVIVWLIVFAPSPSRGVSSMMQVSLSVLNQEPVGNVDSCSIPTMRRNNSVSSCV